MQAEINIGMLGHVDHGKTTLTKALTGKWTDTHSEELKRGISIRLGYADAIIYKCPKCGLATLKQECEKCKTKTEVKRKISIVDAPGHETLMTTVIAGASILDAALFLIAANEPCPQPQTVEHMIVLNTTGIKNIIVVQTKVDLVSKEKALEHYRNIREFLKGTVAENAPIIPVAANLGVNIDALVQKIEEVMPTPKRDDASPLRMYISRSFDINLPGTKIDDLKGGVVGGSIVSGKLTEGDEIEISPGVPRKEGAPPEKIITKAESLREETEILKEAKPGGLIAVCTGIDPALAKSDGLVGNVLGKKGEVPEPTSEITIQYEMLKRPDMENPPLKETEIIVANIHTYTGIGVIKNLKKGTATIKLKRPAVVYPDMNIALSRKIGQRWRLAAWGKIKS
ncbi:MAG: translation initiation factor IF-2 subunit gamma [Candidatus Bilamarchaeaceae archaeon]